MGPDGNQAGSVIGIGPLDRFGDCLQVITVRNSLGMPAVGLEPLWHVLRPGHRGGAIELDAVVVVQVGQLAQPQVPREGGGLGRDALLEIAIGTDGVYPVIDQRMVRPVEFRGQATLGDRHSDAVRKALAEWAGGCLDARRQPEFGMAGRARAPLAEGLEVVEGQVIAGQEEERIEEHARVSCREDESVTVGPIGPVRGVTQKSGPQDVRHRRGSHRRPWMSRVRPLDRIDRQRPNGVDGKLVEALGGDRHGWQHSRWLERP